MGNPSGSRLNFTDEFKEVTILFADIKGFTEFSAKHQPIEVVEMLSSLYMDFDKLCFQYGLYKLYTIGDCYVCMGFNDARNRNPSREAFNTIQFGFAIIDVVKKVRKLINFNGLDMRIGIHTVSLYTIWFNDS